MKVNRLSVEYMNRVVEFLQLTKRNLPDNNENVIVLVFFWNMNKHGK